MSDVNTLTDLAGFVAKSPLASQDINVRRAAMDSLKTTFLPPRRKSSDLLGIVMALSARTRRMVQPKTGVALDVFAPDNRRAVVMKLAQD